MRTIASIALTTTLRCDTRRPGSRTAELRSAPSDVRERSIIAEISSLQDPFLLSQPATRRRYYKRRRHRNRPRGLPRSWSKPIRGLSVLACSQSTRAWNSIRRWLLAIGRRNLRSRGTKKRRSWTRLRIDTEFTMLGVSNPVIMRGRPPEHKAQILSVLDSIIHDFGKERSCSY